MMGCCPGIGCCDLLLVMPMNDSIIPVPALSMSSNGIPGVMKNSSTPSRTSVIPIHSSGFFRMNNIIAIAAIATIHRGIPIMSSITNPRMLCVPGMFAIFCCSVISWFP